MVRLFIYTYTNLYFYEYKRFEYAQVENYFIIYYVALLHVIILQLYNEFK